MSQTISLSEAALKRAETIFRWYRLVARNSVLGTDNRNRYTFNEIAEKADRVLTHQLVVIMAILRYKGIPDYETLKVYARRLGLAFDESILKAAHGELGDLQVIENFTTPIDRWLGQTISLTKPQQRSVQKRLAAYRSAFRQDPCTVEGMRAIADKYPVVALSAFIISRAATATDALSVIDLYADGSRILGPNFSDDGFANDLRLFRLNFCMGI